MLAFLTDGLFLAILAQTLIGLSLIWDKILLRKPGTQNVVNYVFWLGGMSIFGLALIPFGFHMPPLRLAAFAFLAGVVHLAANYFYYLALNAGEASETLAIMGGFSPLFTALIAIPLLDKPLGGRNAWGFGLMVAGGFLMFGAERAPLQKILPHIILAAGLFGLTNDMQKLVFNQTNFVSGYVFFTLGTFGGAMFFLIRPSWREEIFRDSEKAPPKSRFWYFVNRFVSGVGSFLIFLAVSRENPAIVDAISGLRYVIIFLGAYIVTKWRPDWLKEEFHGWALVTKFAATGLVVAGLVWVGISGGGAAATGRLPQHPRPLLVAQQARPSRN